jgi:single-strand DNA-binding protein
MSINKVILVGYVGKDPTIRYFDKGVAKVNFPLATSETYTNQQGETINNTEWHNIVLWRALAEVAEKTVKKGAQVYIVGKIKTRSYVDKDGVNKYITEILADTLLLLEKKQSLTNGASNTETGSNDIQSKESPGYEVNESTTAYQSAGENNHKSPDEKGKSGDKEFGIDTERGNSQNEDDLPF